MGIGDDDHDRTEDLRALARYARERLDLYRARSYGPRPTSETRLRELERQSEQAVARLRAYVAQRASAAGPEEPPSPPRTR
ncbi:MAG: hypothetical protein QOJ63_2199 [Solirubrobacteraceae bacterium]|nr:hypothetical protein [Solirubrobacteraceae bacterium]